MIARSLTALIFIGRVGRVPGDGWLCSSTEDENDDGHSGEHNRPGQEQGQGQGRQVSGAAAGLQEKRAGWLFRCAVQPKGQEGNWLQTVQGKSWWLALRIYGPEEAWIKQTWRPGEIEHVK